MMRETREIKSVKDLIQENEELHARIDFLQKEVERITSMGMFEFANEFCNDSQLEEAGHALAHSLLGKPMTDEDVKIAETESRYDYYVGDDF